MSKDWIEEEESTEETAEGEESASGPSGAGKRTVFTLGTVVALGLVLTLKGGRLYDRFFPASPQTAGASVPAAVHPGVITITRTTPATRPAPAPVKLQPVTKTDLPPATQPAKALAIAATLPSVPAATPSPESTRLTQARATLEHLRDRLHLYTTQHAGAGPEFAKYPAWHQLTQRTRADGATDPRGPFGPYLDAAPVNPLNDCGVIGLTARTPKPGQTLRTDGKLGWVYCVTSKTLYATAADGKTILDDK